MHQRFLELIPNRSAFTLLRTWASRKLELASDGKCKRVVVRVHRFSYPFNYIPPFYTSNSLTWDPRQTTLCELSSFQHEFRYTNNVGSFYHEIWGGHRRATPHTCSRNWAGDCHHYIHRN